MSYVILSPSKQYFTGDWNEESPEWDSDFQKAWKFSSKEQALDLMREHIKKDIENEKQPGFLGARVWLLDEREIVVKELVRKGFNVSRQGETIWLDFDPIKTSLEMARKSFPRSLYGIDLLLRSKGLPYSWD